MVSKFLRARTVQLAIEKKEKAEIGKMIETGYYMSLTLLNLITPLLPIPKARKALKSGDYKSTINVQLAIATP